LQNRSWSFAKAREKQERFLGLSPGVHIWGFIIPTGCAAET